MTCFFCGGVEGKLIQSSRIPTVIESSRLRGEGLLDKIVEGTINIECHSNCISTYCSKHHIERLLSKRQSSGSDKSKGTKRLRSQTCFNFMQHCLFCGEECFTVRPVKHPDRWRGTSGRPINRF